MERIVLTVCGEDVKEYADPDNYRAVVDNDLMDAVLERAAKYMQYSIDGSDFFGDSISEAVASVLSDNGIYVD